jgi:ornithine lipid ester-linked acyl 2-hydroxylase
MKEKVINYEDVITNTKKSIHREKWLPWKNYFLYCYGNEIKENCIKCPETIKTIKKIPGMKTAFFSIFLPNTHLTPHRGPYKGVLRYHLGLKIPKNKELCKIKILNGERTWEKGKSLIFDDSHIHEAWNKSQEIRVVLFVDFERPLKFPLSKINETFLKLAKSAKSTIETANNIKEAQNNYLNQNNNH